MARLGRGQPNRPLIRRNLAAPSPSGDLTVTGTADVALTGTPGRSDDLTVTGSADVVLSGTKKTGIGAPPRPRTRWQLVLGPASGGHELALTEASNRRYTARLRDNSDMAFDLDGRVSQAAAIEELSTDVHLLFSDASGTTILDRCRVGTTSDDVDDKAHKVDVTGLDYRAVLARRQLYTGDTLTYTATDQAEIAWGLISSTQARAAGALGIAKGWEGTTPTGQFRDRTYEAGDKIGERIQELSEVIDGFDWDIAPVSASGLRLDVWFPERGTDRGVVLEQGGLAAHVRRDVTPSDYANALRYTGAAGDDTTPGPTPVELEASLLAQAELWPQGRWDAVFGDDGLKDQSALDDRAAWQLAQGQVVTPVYTVTLKRGGWDGPDHIWLGDPVRLVVRSGRLDVDTTLRVYEITIDMDGNGGEGVQLSLGGPRPDYRRRPRDVERRLTNLERR